MSLLTPTCYNYHWASRKLNTDRPACLFSSLESTSDRTEISKAMPKSWLFLGYPPWQDALRQTHKPPPLPGGNRPSEHRMRLGVECGMQPHRKVQSRQAGGYRACGCYRSRRQEVRKLENRDRTTANLGAEVSPESVG